MNRRTLIVRCLMFVCLVAAPLSRAAETVDLKLRPAANQVVRLKTTIEQKVTNTINGTPQTMTQTIGLGYAFETLSFTSDGSAVVKVTFDGVTFKQNSPLANVDYDSANPPAQIHPMARGFAALAGQTFTMTVSPTGKVTDIKGLDAMVDAILAKLALPEGPAKAVVEKSVRKEFGEEAVRDNMAVMVGIYPEQPVGVGQSWSRKISMSKGIPLVMDNTYTLKNVAGDDATLEMKGKLTTNADAPPMDLGSRKLSYTLGGETSGTMKLSKQTGWVKAAEITQKLSGEMTTDAGAGRTAKTPITVDTKIVIEGK